MDDICTYRTDDSTIYNNGFLQTPRDAHNLYPPNQWCEINICLSAPHVMIHLKQFNIPIAVNGGCNDYVQIGSDLILCNASLQDVFIPLMVEGCLKVKFVSNNDERTGSGAKLEIKGEL